MLSSVWKDPPSARLKQPAGDRRADPRHRPLHGRRCTRVYERADPLGLQRGATACASRRCRPGATASMPTVGATRPARAACAGPRSRRAAWSWPSGTASFVDRARPGAAGRQRVRPADRPGLHAARAAHAGGLEPGAHRRQGAADRGRSCARCPRSRHVSTWVGGAGQRNQASLNIALDDRQRARAHAEASRRRHPRGDRQGPRHRCIGRLQPADLRRHPRQRPRGPGARGHRVRRQGEEDPRRRRRRVLGQARPAGLRGAPEARRGARARPHRAAAGLAACVPTSTARPPPTGPRPTATRSTWCCACTRASASASSRCAALPVAFAARRHADRAGQRGRHRTASSTPRCIRRQNLQRREAHLRRRQGPQPPATSATTCRS